MRIRKKFFITILSLCLAVLAFLTALNFVTLLNLKNDLSQNQSRESESIRNTTVESMERYGENFAIAVNESYGVIVDNKLNEIASDVVAIKRCLESLYKTYTPVNSDREANRFLLAPGVSMSQVQEEYNRVKAIESVANSVLAKEEKINIFYASQSGFLLANLNHDYSSSSNVDRRERDWYKGAVKNKGVFWTEVYADLITDQPMVTCSAPVYWPNGELAGVVEEDVEIVRICKNILKENSQTIKYSFLLSESGKFIIGSEENTKLTSVLSEQQREKLISQINSNKGSSGSLVEDGFISGFSTVESTKWTLGVILNYDKIVEPADEIKNSIVSEGVKNEQYITEQIRNQIILNLIFSAVICLVTLFVSRKISASITEPLAKLRKAVKVVSEGNLDHEILVKSTDEVGELAISFNNMAVKLKDQIERVSRVMAEKGKLSSELNIAKTIQKSMLPCVFPAFPTRDEIDVYATMDPAKQVGGDFYDFFFVDENNVALVVADVSGKGVPAALFMVIAKTLIRDRSQSGLSPGKVLEVVNKKLCETNGAEMFLTCFIAVLNVVTGKLTYANAGHNLPLIFKNNEKFDWIDVKAGFVLAAFPELEYKEREITMNEGDRLFLYTDGVTEALNRKNELYTNQRLVNRLNEEDTKNKTAYELLQHVMESISDFVGGSVQSDDITMLSLTLNHLSSSEIKSQEDNKIEKSGNEDEGDVL
ncbi:MAG: SpoIIE family protein phosphatase [Oscillospiraceae bacterium]|jgi:sigma-B regulation protein RsbU (phosphoserine phosphatase)|nr:SpoIIE family protein phosphatase [Oscillospiraceae bacterium]